VETVGTIIMFSGLLVAVVGKLWMLVKIFETGILWGVGALLCGLVGLIWLVMHWQRGWRPFALSLSGAAVMLLGGLLMEAARS